MIDFLPAFSMNLIELAQCLDVFLDNPLSEFQAISKSFT